MNAMSLAWTFYNHDKRGAFNRAAFALALRAAHAEIKRRIAFDNAKFAPKAKPFDFGAPTVTMDVYSESKQAWVAVTMNRIAA